MRRAALLALITVTALLCAPAAPAQAAPISTIDIPSGEVHFVAGDGQANHIVVTRLSGTAHTYRFDDVFPIVFNDVHPVSSGACTHPQPADQTVLDCAYPASIISVRTGDLDDVISYRTDVSWQLEAGEGDDVIRTGTDGGAGDYTTGGGGDDLVTRARATSGSSAARGWTPSPTWVAGPR
ncbi:MAG: hypothetical protein HOV79_29805 [Hamadaea sp.]|nr:hypothetical protein [Hamadaea sp.]